MARHSFAAPFVVFKLASGANIGKLRLAIAVRVQADNTADLFVFGRPADGAPFTSGPAYVTNVPKASGALGNGQWSPCPQPTFPSDTPFPGIGDLA